MPEVAALAEAPALAAGEEALVALSAALGTRNPERVRGALLRALLIASAEQVEEVILQAHLFIGFPDVLDALAAWRELSGFRAPADAAGDDATWERRGEEVCRTVYARNYEKLRANVRALHPDLERWMVVGGYGRVLGREALPLVLRELAILALLAVWNAPRQLHSHLRGALNAGAQAEAVERAVELAAAVSAPEAARTARALWDEVRERMLR